MRRKSLKIRRYFLSSKEDSRLSQTLTQYETSRIMFCIFEKQAPQKRKNYTKNSALTISDKIFTQEGLYQIYIRGHILKLRDDTSNKVINEYKIIKDYYLKYGESFYEYLDGLFFIALYDKDRAKLILANNRYQATQLYYFEDDKIFAFSHSLTTLVRSISKNWTPNKNSILSFISNGFTMTDQTQIKGVRKLLPSFALIYEDETTKLINHWKNEFSFKRKKIESINTHLDLYENIYRDGISTFLNKYKSNEVGTLMSGGHDTSFVMAQASQVFNKPIHTFTTTFPGWAFDENEYAANISKKFKGIHHTIPFLPEDLDSIVGLIRVCEEPVVGSSLPLHLCAREAAKHVDTMLAGDGGDTLWGEYYPVAEFHRYIKNLPILLRKSIYKASHLARRATDWERFWELEHVASLFTKKDYYKDFMRKLCTYRHFTDDEQQLLLQEDIFKNAKASPGIFEVIFNKENFHDALIEGKLFNAFYTYQSFHTTKSMESFGHNFYLPCINKDLIDFICSLPKNYINGGTTFHRLTNNKKINRKFHKLALARYLRSDEIYNRSFDIPWSNILRPRRELLIRLKERLLDRGWYQSDYIIKLFNEFQSQNVKSSELLELKNHGYRIFTLLSLEVWAIEFLDGRFTKDFQNKIPMEVYLKN